MRRLIQALGAASLLAILLIGCSKGAVTGGNATPPAITAEPANVTVTAG